MAGLETEHENLAPFSSEVTGEPPFSLSTWGTNYSSVLSRSDQSQLSIASVPHSDQSELSIALL